MIDEETSSETDAPTVATGGDEVVTVVDSSDESAPSTPPSRECNNG